MTSSANSGTANNSSCAFPRQASGLSVDDVPMLEPSKKLTIMMILEILMTETDSEHRLNQREILDLLMSRYGRHADRKTVKRNLDDLIAMGFPISWSKPKTWSKGTRTVVDSETGESEERDVKSCFWYEHAFTMSELRLLVDSILFSKHIPHGQRRELIDKLVGLSSRYFRPHIGHIYTMPDNLPQNPQLFWTIQQLDEAIEAGRKVAFRYLTCDVDKVQRPRCYEDGTVREYVVSPYQMVAKEGKYYLICNYDPYPDISNYRVDRISDIRILDEKVKPFETLQGSDGMQLDLAKYICEHIYMYASDNIRCTFRVKRKMIADVLDLFGCDVDIREDTEDYAIVTARVTELAMRQFAKNYAPDVLILEPRELADRVCLEAMRTLIAYGKMEKEQGIQRSA